jgi:hypothetical protein
VSKPSFPLAEARLEQGGRSVVAEGCGSADEVEEVLGLVFVAAMEALKARNPGRGACRSRRVEQLACAERGFGRAMPYDTRPIRMTYTTIFGK